MGSGKGRRGVRDGVGGRTGDREGWGGEERCWVGREGRGGEEGVT